VVRVDRPCDWERTEEGCEKPATCKVNTILGWRYYCEAHGGFVAMVEAEWDQAEAEYLEQG
jgi:hypothetical protein